MKTWLKFKLIKPIPLLLRVWTDRMEISRLDNGRTISRSAITEFSNSRIVVAHFGEAETLLKEIMGELVFRKFGFSRNISFAVQQMERSEGGLSSVEARALLDLCKHAGAAQVKLYDQTQDVSIQRALDNLSNL